MGQQYNINDIQRNRNLSGFAIFSQHPNSKHQASTTKIYHVFQQTNNTNKSQLIKQEGENEIQRTYQNKKEVIRREVEKGRNDGEGEEWRDQNKRERKGEQCRVEPRINACNSRVLTTILPIQSW